MRLWSRKPSPLKWSGLVRACAGSVDVDDFMAAFVVGGLVDVCMEGLDVRSW